MHFWRRLHRSTRWAGIGGGVISGIVLSPFVVAALMLRSSSDAHGPEPAAYVVLGIVLLMVMIAGGVVAGVLAALVRRVVTTLRGPGARSR